VKNRSLVAGGRAKPWRQKGTGRARQGTTRAAQWKGGGVAFAPRSEFEVKLNKKERRAALRAALTDHAQAGTFGVIGAGFDAPSARAAVALIDAWGKDLPLVVVATEDEDAIGKSFRNLEKVIVTVPSQLEVSELVWANAVLVSEAALPFVQARAS
jgi:large subunit ribosomal protein L4